jgi:hypothetical protein
MVFDFGRGINSLTKIHVFSVVNQSPPSRRMPTSHVKTCNTSRWHSPLSQSILRLRLFAFVII